MALAVIIPAHDEEVALRRCLAALARQSYAGEVEVTVVANGCQDATVAVALESQDLLPPNFTLDVIELPVAAKWQALNAADAAARSAARVYLDADIVLSPSALEGLVAVLAEDGPRLVQPEVVVGWKGRVSPYPVRAFVRVWSALPYVRDQVLGLGCYAVNPAGRALWDAFPPLGADDTFVRFRFDDADKRVVRGATMTLSFPTSLRELIHVRARWCRLSREVRRREPVLPPSERHRWATALHFIATHPFLWLDGLAFTAIWACAVAFSRLPTPEENWARAATSEIRLSIDP
jgi:cellulose synthase/poly-beta-1,6-N-acetylglucosamine synthase-like glycosyltransferase